MAQNDLLRESETPLSYEHLLWDGKLVLSILAQAEIYESLLAKCVAEGQLSLDMGQLVRLRAVGLPVGSKES